MLQRASPEVGQSTPPRILIRVDLPWIPADNCQPSIARSSNDRSRNRVRGVP